MQCHIPTEQIPHISWSSSSPLYNRCNQHFMPGQITMTDVFITICRPSKWVLCKCRK